AKPASKMPAKTAQQKKTVMPVKRGRGRPRKVAG
ncbi:terminase, partial [Kluyvera sp. Nf5]